MIYKILLFYGNEFYWKNLIYIFVYQAALKSSRYVVLIDYQFSKCLESNNEIESIGDISSSE